MLTYAEALYDSQLKKGNRNDIADRHAIGFHDVVLPDGDGKSRRLSRCGGAHGDICR